MSQDAPIHFACPHCAKRLVTAREKSGKRVKCPKCGMALNIPRVEKDQVSSSSEPNSKGPDGLANERPILQEPESGKTSNGKTALLCFLFVTFAIVLAIAFGAWSDSINRANPKTAFWVDAKTGRFLYWDRPYQYHFAIACAVVCLFAAIVGAKLGWDYYQEWRLPGLRDDSPTLFEWLICIFNPFPLGLLVGFRAKSHGRYGAGNKLLFFCAVLCTVGLMVGLFVRFVL